MIMIKIEMWPHGNEARKRDLAAIAVVNVGGDSDRGDYAYSISHQLDSDHGAQWVDHTVFAESVGEPSVSTWKCGTVERFKRASGVVRLLGRVLASALARS